MSYQSPFNLPDEHMRLVGIVAVHWECLDVAIQKTLAEVMDHKFERVALLTENLPFRAKMDLLSGYVKMLKDTAPSFCAEYSPLEKAVMTANGLRNAFVHARWKPGPSPDVLVRIVVRAKGGKIVIQEIPTTSADIGSAAHTIWDTGNRFTSFFMKAGLLKA